MSTTQQEFNVIVPKIERCMVGRGWKLDEEYVPFWKPPGSAQ